MSLGFYATTTANSWVDKISAVTVTPAVVDPNAPTSNGAALTALEDTATALAAGNFGYADPNHVALAEVQVTTLPVLGTLMLNGTPVSSAALPLPVLAANISTLTYQSAANGNGTPYTTMGITHLDLVRRCAGSFTYDGGEQYGPGRPDDDTYYGHSSYSGLSPTATYVLTYSLALKKLCITGKDANPAGALSKQEVAAAVASGHLGRYLTARSMARTMLRVKHAWRPFTPDSPTGCMI